MRQFSFRSYRPTLFAVALAALFLATGIAGAQTWKLSDDFSLERNPHGVWTFGWQDQPGGKVNSYDLAWGTQNDSEVKGFFSPGWFGPVRAWCATRADARHMINALPSPGELYYPDHWVEANFDGEELVRQAAGLPSYPDVCGYVGKNTSDAPFGSWGYFWEPGTVLLMPPGQRGKEAVTTARWTSPVTAKVIVTAKFSGQRIQGDSGTRADVRVRHNVTPVFDGRLDGFVGRRSLNFDDALGPTPTQEFSTVLSVAGGDTIDFAVGAGTIFNYGVFGIQNKQLLPGVGLEAQISVLPEEKALAQRWIAAKFEGASEETQSSTNVINYGSSSSEPPFSFVYGGKPFAEQWRTWKLERSTRPLDDGRTERTLQFTDPNSGLVVRCVGVEYHSFPTVEWTVFLKNSGAADTPIIDHIQAIDVPIERDSVGEFSLHRIADHFLLETRLEPSTVRRIADPFPYFNIELPGAGLIVAISWSGQAAIEFARDETTGLRVRGGQALTHFKLHPGEELRMPMIVLQFWSGDRTDAQNVWRRWMLAHNMPRPEGKTLGPQRAASSAYQFGNMVNATEENQKQFIARYVEEGLKPDFWWMDAGWYPPNISKNGTQLWALTGTWEPDKRRFPNGLRAVTDYAHSKKIKSIVWCQPERVSPGTWLDLNHPEWLLGTEGADRLFNFGNRDAWRWAVEHFGKLIADEGVDIYRQDMNIGPVGFWQANDANDRQGITEIYHVMGYLSYLDELVRRNPRLRLDHFRVDLETLRRAAPLILGVDFDPVADQCHNYRVATWIPWHGLCTRVIEPYDFRSMMCPAIVTGWDLRRTDLNYDLCRRLIGEWEQIAPNYLGDFYPLTPYTFDDGVWMAWQFDRPDNSEGIVQAFRRRDSSRESATFRLRGLDTEARYRLRDLDGGSPAELSGAELMERGLPITVAPAPGAVVIMYRKL